MIGELPHDFDDRINLVYGLYKLFLEIDFNGDEFMQWEEFTQFIIDTVMGENDNEKVEEEDEYLNSGKDLTEKQLTKFKRYQVNKQVDDNVKHDKEIIDAAFISKLDILFVAEYNSHKILVINPKTGKLRYQISLEQYLSGDMLHKLKKTKSGLEAKGGNQKENKKSLGYSVLSIAVSNKNIVVY